MMKNLRCATLATAMTAAVLAGAPSAAQGAAACAPLPEVAWWNTSHEKMARAVAVKHNGDWAPYIAQWTSYRDRMRKLHAGGGTAVVKSRGLKLKGAALKRHIAEIEKRIDLSQASIYWMLIP